MPFWENQRSRAEQKIKESVKRFKVGNPAQEGIGLFEGWPVSLGRERIATRLKRSVIDGSIYGDRVNKQIQAAGINRS